MAKRKYREPAAQVYVGFDERGRETWFMVMLPEAFRWHAAFWAWLKYGGWQPIDTAPSGKPVLVHYRNSHGKGRTIKARWVARWTEEASFEAEDGCSEYNEENDTYYVTEGWWECVDNWDDFTEVKVSEGVPTHWHPLPEPSSEGEKP